MIGTDVGPPGVRAGHFGRMSSRSVALRKHNKMEPMLMNAKLVTIAATLVCTTVFGQGKLGFRNGDLQHLIYFATDTTLLAPADANKTVNGYPLAGSGLYTGPGSTIEAL